MAFWNGIIVLRHIEQTSPGGGHWRTELEWGLGLARRRDNQPKIKDTQTMPRAHGVRLIHSIRYVSGFVRAMCLCVPTWWRQRVSSQIKRFICNEFTYKNRSTTVRNTHTHIHSKGVRRYYKQQRVSEKELQRQWEFCGWHRGATSISALDRVCAWRGPSFKHIKHTYIVYS